MIANDLLFPDAAHERRFWAKVDKSGDCWIWTGSLRAGYGRFAFNLKLKSAHRVSYANLVGPIPSGMVIDHLCFMPACVKPSHLRAVTQKQNSEHLRGASADNKTSGVRGVSWYGRTKKWQVNVTSNGKRFHAGYFDDIAEAEAAAIAMRARLFTHDDHKELTP